MPRYIRLPPTPESVSTVRDFVGRCCAEWGLVNTSEVAVLLASELATNAVRHARTPVTVWLGKRPDRLVLSVEDASHEPATARHPNVLDEGGRGLELVDALSERWGEKEMPTGKLVWAEIRTAPRRRSTHERQAMSDR